MLVITEVQTAYNYLKRFGFGLRRNDKKWNFPTCYEFINIQGVN